MQRPPNRRFSLRTMDVLRKVLPARVYYRYIGRHERGSMRVWGRLVAGLRPNSAVLDVGAYHGMYALATRDVRPDLAIFAFEPNEKELEHLRAACSGKDIGVVTAAVTDQSGFVSFATSGETSHVVDDDTDADNSTTVKAIALDHWDAAADIDVSLMKVDVEGGEDAVFRGARRLMETSRPLVLCEILTEAAGRRVATSLPDNYVFFEINEDRGPSEAAIPTRNHYRHKNWLLVPQELRAEIPTRRDA